MPPQQIERPGRSDQKLSTFTDPEIRQTTRETMSDAHRAAADKLYPEYVADPNHMIDVHGKPIFDASFKMKYDVTEKEMTEGQRLQFKQYQLWKTTLKIDRRDSVYEAFATSGDVTNGSPMQNFLGAPWPIIEPKPTFVEVIKTIRWYEHTISFVLACGFFAHMRARPKIRYSGASVGVQRALFPFMFTMCEFQWGHIAGNRLRGLLDNEYECDRFGVLESNARLKEKVRFWERYRKYKEEWMKRYDYYVYGMRPGERYTIMSACHIPPSPVRYCKRTDFKMRTNPFVLTETPISIGDRKKVFDHIAGHELGTPRPMDFIRPENRYFGTYGPAAGHNDGDHGKRNAPTGKLFT